MSELLNIKDTVQKFAEVLKEVIKFDVEIVDNKLVRVAVTGEYANEEEQLIEKGNIYKIVLKTKQMIVLENPKENELCNGCKKFDECKEVCEVSYPIILDENVIGVIGFLCYTQEQKQRFLENRESIIKFIDQISKLIALKVKFNIENYRLNNMLKVLKTVINKVGECVLLVNSKNELVDYNHAGAKFLNYNKDLKIEFLKPETKDEKYTFTILINNRNYYVYGEVYEFNSIDESYKIAIFNDVADSNFNDANIILDEIKGESEYIKELKDKIKRIAKNSSTVLITGESGTGKELIARAIHSLSERRTKPFIAINCAAIPDTLLESELFGYERGTFSGADPRGKIGKFEMANGGTIFLDEIADMPLHMQVKLLRVLQEKTITRIGSHQSQKVDVRIIAATNKNIQQLVKENKFREDLYYRLNVIPIHTCPLRERKEDIKVLVQHYLNKYQVHFNRKGIKFDKDVLDMFYRYDWPGNVRELENLIEYIVAMVDDNTIIDKSLLPMSISNGKGEILFKDEVYNLKQLEMQTINKVIKMCGDSTEGRLKAAELLGIGVATLYRKLKNYQIDNNEDKIK
ncbi:sigma-54-dependent Fis family transcriptional regulator [Thermobrachium celere]|uniref:Putative sigma-54-dependent transcriptional regulator n=1 Tax=Thermobrachium celere DSM 8682 TaxID=941824 RepID=R7RMA6_9CLOT|nr:sigma 54-interacting transcriptional regulator [Thermobrachium celere]CDF57154.1 putative sigma-54-dependent transcriptional regulator [Thermobrachium celere DSM 8682]